ncbi:MAG TPA: hypothetical protein PLE77_14240 [Kiritimatiellia bacterium]|nr:hypothetical protein [Kiritimatiellia bacterium]
MKRYKQDKEGVALVAVLGFLGVMLLLAVSLSIAMRTERLTSEAGRDDMKTRQLLHTAVARAMADVNDFMRDANPSVQATKDDWLYAPGAESSVARPTMIHLPRDFALLPSLSVDASTRTLQNDGIELISGEIEDWLPSKYLTTGGGAYDAASKAAGAEWINIVDPQTNIILGRVAYLVVDCTGLLDVNLITTENEGAPARREGESIGEIDARLLPEVKTRENAQFLYENRAFYHRFDSLPEIIYLNDGTGGQAAFKEEHAIDADALNNLTPYSLSYDRGWWKGNAAGVGTWESTFAGAPLNLKDWTAADAQNVFAALGFANPTDMARCFEDYTDADFIPGGSGGANFDVPCCEPIPMVNEIDAGVQARHDGSNYFLDVYVDIELCYPFPTVVTNDRQYTVEYHSLGIVAGGVGAVTLSAMGGITSTPPFTVVEGGGWYQTVRFQLVSAPIMVWTPPTINVLLNNFDIRVRDNDTGTDVDRTVNSGAPGLTLLVAGIAKPSAGASSPPKSPLQSLRCNDPRVNHLTDARCWSQGPKSLGAANIGAIFSAPLVWNQTTNGGFEGSLMFVRNGPMQSVAEMGFIPTGAPWETIDLLSSAGADLLSKFRVEPLNTVNPYLYGKINPHSLNTSVWYSVFVGCPMSEYPGDGGAYTVGVSRAESLVKSLADYNAEDDSWGADSFDGFADWVGIQALRRGSTDNWGRDPRDNGKPLSNMQAEGVIRNSYRLFSPNQNLFTIIVVAQAINDQGVRGVYEPDVDTILGEKRAVALVWRDPFPNPATGRNEMFIRMLRYIDQ